ncbi:hypothetical protein CHS0354_015468 [Potamilus streckersoni]|uniref:Uncharacterized protein n=1 Tax=Potamilus streckersoni TaxID=2493646 RepID=A0AAE0VGZ8_9BIVA|nr:hypothetical protein CHS0354_015468 [Potamilus streckersoni]
MLRLSPLPAPSPCMSELNNNMRQCYSQVGLNPDLFTPSGSQMTGAVIGENREIAGKFCRNRVNLFECMRKTLDSCPGAREIMSLSGYDHDSLEKGIDVLCHDVNVYVKGLVCFQNPSPQVQACVDTMVGRITDLTARQLQQPMPMDQFYNQFCQSRIQHMECDLGAWKGQCERAAIGLKNEFECNLLPSRCRRDATLQSKLQQTCAIQNFARELRSGATSSEFIGFDMDFVLFLLAMFPSFALGQVARSQNVQSACAQAGRIAVSQCFKSNGSFQMTDVISLLSNRTQRPLSLNSDQLRRRICQNQSEIITCMSKNINGLQNTQHCSTQNDFKRLEQETVGFINRIQTTCGHGQVLCTSFADCQVIATQRNQTHDTCAPLRRNAVAMCFQSNGGFKMQNVITLLSNGSQETIPPVVNQLIENMCRDPPNKYKSTSQRL